MANLNTAAVTVGDGYDPGSETWNAVDLCLFFDVDGTLLEFVEAPDAALADSELHGLLQRARAATCGATALVSGRSLEQIDRIFGPVLWPAAGLHGLERRDAAGRIHRQHVDPGRVDVALREFQRIASRHPGVEIEDKGLTVALHFRRAPELAADLTAEVEQVADGLGGGYHVQAGSCVLEVRPVGATKADAVEAFLAEPPFAGRRPVYAGDDLTDVGAFEAVQRAGGLSMAVGGRVHAMLNFPTVTHFRRYLSGLVQS